MADEQAYSPSAFGGNKEEAMVKKFQLQRDDAKNYFTTCTRPRLDRWYKLYIAYNGDRAKEIKRWQANITVPYVEAVVETLMPRILDARPEFIIQGRNENDQLKASKLQNLTDYTWEISGMDNTSEILTRSCLIYGTGFLQVSWKKDVRTNKFLQTKDLVKKKYEWKEETKTFYDAPYAEWVDNYGLWYDWHNIPRESKQFWFKRLILTGAEIKRKYPMADVKRLKSAFVSGAGDLTDYASIRNEVKSVHDRIVKGADYVSSSTGITNTIYQTQDDPDLKMHEVFEWWRPFEDAYAVMVNDVPILKGGVMPNPYNFKESPFIEITYLKLPNEFEGYGIPAILEQPQIMLNMIKNQRLDAVTLGIHKMWIVNPLANIDKRELVTRPFGIIYSPDPNGVREVQFSDVKASSYKEEELLKSDMRYGAGVDDFSMGGGSKAGSATEVRHLREATLERVRLFINHLGETYSILMRYWMSMYLQFFTKKMTIRVIGEDGEVLYPLIEKDDLMGQFDYKAAVLPSISGKNDIDKKQGMDLFQLLINLPFVDPRKLTSKVLHSWNWSLESIAKGDEEQQPLQPGAEGMVGPNGLPVGAEGMMPPGMPVGPPTPKQPPQMPRMKGGGTIPPAVIKRALKMLGGVTGGSQFTEASSPINLLKGGPIPPTVLPLKTSNPRGLNRGGKVNTNIPLKPTSNPEASLLNQAQNIQK